MRGVQLGLRTVVERLEDVPVQSAGLGRLEGQAELQGRVGEALPRFHLQPLRRRSGAVVIKVTVFSEGEPFCHRRALDFDHLAESKKHF